MQNDLVPDYLSSLVPPTVGSTAVYNLRNDSDLRTISANSQLYYNSFLPSVTRSWNELSENIKDSTSVAAFKHKLQGTTRNPPAYFNAGKRLGQVYHARLRLNCSSLRHHLFLKNVLDNPFCECGAVEDNKHFLFECEQFSLLRQELIDTVSLICQPNLDNLLYGSENLTNDENEKIFLAVQEFIIKYKRF